MGVLSTNVEAKGAHQLSLSKGAKVNVLEKNGHWAWCQAGEDAGWVPAKYITLGSSSGKTDSLNASSGAGELQRRDSLRASSATGELRRTGSKVSGASGSGQGGAPAQQPQTQVPALPEPWTRCLSNTMILHTVQNSMILANYLLELLTGGYGTRSALHIACWEGSRHAVQAVTNGSKKTVLDWHKRKGDLTPLHIAAICGHVSVVDYLLELDVDPNIHTVHGLRSLHISSSSNCELSETLLVGKADAMSRTADQDTPLHFASCYQQLETMELLLKAGADAAACNNFGVAPLHVAAAYAALEGLELDEAKAALLLCAHGADLDARDHQGHSAADIARMAGGQRDLVEFLRPKGAGAKGVQKRAQDLLAGPKEIEDAEVLDAAKDTRSPPLPPPGGQVSQGGGDDEKGSSIIPRGHGSTADLKLAEENARLSQEIARLQKELDESRANSKHLEGLLQRSRATMEQMKSTAARSQSLSETHGAEVAEAVRGDMEQELQELRLRELNLGSERESWLQERESLLRQLQDVSDKFERSEASAKRIAAQRDEAFEKLKDDASRPKTPAAASRPASASPQVLEQREKPPEVLRDIAQRIQEIEERLPSSPLRDARGYQEDLTKAACALDALDLSGDAGACEEKRSLLARIEQACAVIDGRLTAAEQAALSEKDQALALSEKEQALSQKDAELAARKQAEEEAKQALGSKEEEISSLATELEAVRAESESRARELEEKAVEVSKREAELTGLKAEAQRLSGEVTRQAKEKEETWKCLTDLRAQHKELREQQSSQIQQFGAAQAKFQEKEVELEGKLKEEELNKQKLESEVADLSAQVAALDGAMERAQQAEKLLEPWKKRTDELHEAFQKEQSMRKRYHNQMQDMKGAIRVYARIRPMVARESDQEVAVWRRDAFSLELQDKHRKGEKKDYNFDAVFDERNSQEDVFADCRGLIGSAVDGYNVTVFAYGQTGAGKTHTMYGSESMPGLVPRAANELFEVLGRYNHECESRVLCSMFELYLDDLIDLLVTKTKGKTPPALDIKKDSRGTVKVENSVEIQVQSPDELQRTITTGMDRRHVAATKMNADSSRSHLIFIVTIECTNRKTKQITTGKLTICDLAGSERLKKSEVTGEQKKEAASINKSLTALGDVIEALTKQAKHVPYRNHRLTHLLSDSLGGNAKTLMFVNCSPASGNLDETGAALAYAVRAKNIMNKVEKNSDSQEVARLKKVVEKLGQELEQARAGQAGAEELPQLDGNDEE
eukprot:TRINITY_DN5357_c0_g1_i1.p1 TRINITY_DN5357_c0_g1~~TRINITY_DN5357_c0_g1_i1.p1  ORF type:complete len:1397 (+),score=386.71 TRINITY_DN5357_c0_g1_i1:437-4192(+)